MNETPNQNRKDLAAPGKPRATGDFKVNIDERDLATGSFDPAQYTESRPVRSESASGTAYYASDKERKAEKKAHKKRDKLKARKNKRVFSLVWLCMVLLLGFTLASYLIGGSNDFFAVGRNEGSTEVTIPEKLDADSLAELLYQRGAISKPEFFSLYCKVTVDEDEWKYFEPGVYRVDTNMDYQGLITVLQGGNESREEVRVTFPEGSNILEIAQILEDNEVCTRDDFLEAVNTLDFTNYDIIAQLGDTSGKYYKLEGYLFPDTYDFYKGEELVSVIGKMLNNFQTRISDATLSLIQQSGYTMDQIITLASIIQGEAANDSDMFNVSAVLHNRLSFGADYGIYQLQCDSTSCYPYKNPQAVPAEGALSYGNYDTYQIEGLPAGAICNPGMDAIMAALKPNRDGDASSYLYFCHAADGTAYYATNEDDHWYNRELAGLNN